MFSEATIQKIDSFLLQEKVILGKIVWNQKSEKCTYTAKLPLSSNGELIMDFDFEATANSSGLINLQGGTLKILHNPDDNKEKIIVCRMHILPGNCHTNPRIKNCDVGGFYFPPNITRFYSWEDMKILDKSQISNDKHIARSFEHVNSFSESVKFFLVGTLPIDCKERIYFPAFFRSVSNFPSISQANSFSDF